MIKDRIDILIECAKNSGKDKELLFLKEIKNFLIIKNYQTIEDKEVEDIVNTLIISCKKNIISYMDECRDDLVENEQNKLNILKKILNNVPSDKETEREINKFIVDFMTLSCGLPPTIKNVKECVKYVKKTYSNVNEDLVLNIFKNKL